MTGLALHHAWQGEKKVVDFFVVKGVLEGLFDVLGVANQSHMHQQNAKVCTQAVQLTSY